MKQKKTVLIAGGAGFLGSSLARKLYALNYALIIIDNLCTGNKANIASLLTQPDVTFINHDICTPLDISADYIINLACPASPPRYQKDPIFTTMTNVLGTYHLLELAKRYNAVFVQASTSEVYGDPIEHPQQEVYRGNVNPIGIRSCYDEGKRCAESLCFDYHRMHNVAIKVMRIFNTYGPYMDPEDGRVISNFINQALRNQPLTIYGDGSHTRSFCYVDDLIDGIIKLMLSDATITGPINLGNTNEYSLQELAQLIQQLTHNNHTPIFLPLPNDDPTKRKPDITKAEKLLQWRPTTSLIDGLTKTIDYFQSIQSLPLEQENYCVQKTV